MASTVGTRLAFEKAKEAIQRAGFSLGQAVLSQSYLRLEVSLSTTVTNYQFPVLINDVSSTNTAAFNTEQRLQLQDAFYVSSIGLFFAKPSSTTDTAFQLVSYPNSQLFTESYCIIPTDLFNWAIIAFESRRITTSDSSIS